MLPSTHTCGAPPLLIGLSKDRLSGRAILVSRSTISSRRLGQAVQNMNVLMGFPETGGLRQDRCSPEQLHPAVRGRHPTIAGDAFVAPNATLVGDVEIGGARQHLVRLRAARRSRADPRRRCTNVQDGTVVHVSSRDSGGTWIGDHVPIGHLALIHACRSRTAASSA